MDNKEELKASTGISIDETFKEETIKEKSLFVKIFIHSWLKYVVAIFVSIVIILIVLSSKGFKHLVSYCDGLFISGGVLIGVGLLSLLASYGSFDIFSYSGKYVYNKIKNKSVERYPEYSKNKALNREKAQFGYIPYLVVGIMEIIISAILLIIN